MALVTNTVSHILCRMSSRMAVTVYGSQMSRRIVVEWEALYHVIQEGSTSRTRSGLEVLEVDKK